MGLTRVAASPLEPGVLRPRSHWGRLGRFPHLCYPFCDVPPDPNVAEAPRCERAVRNFWCSWPAAGRWAHIRGLDWSKSPLGPPQDWPKALRLAVRLMLNTGHPMYIWWGPELACLYNDAYSRSIGPERHPGSVGLPARTVWAEIWDVIGPQIDHVVSGRGATWHENQLVPITRHGKLENAYGPTASVPSTTTPHPMAWGACWSSARRRPSRSCRSNVLQKS